MKQSALQQALQLVANFKNQMQKNPVNLNNYQQQVAYYKENPHFQFNQNHTPIKWLGEVAQDTAKRGWGEGLQDITYPITTNPYVIPLTEPITSNLRMANYQSGRPFHLLNILLGQQDWQMSPSR
jgi:hypothetical protein